ncbi:MAG: sigma-70 family RNA polymerase sigma factor [Nibricoccus sp.]
MIDDAQCLHNYATTRNQEAFADFVHRNLRLVYSAALRQTRGDAHLAQDVTQVVFTAAAQHAKALAGHPVIAAWLHQTTRNAAIDAIRSQQRRQAREEAVGKMNPTTTESDEAPDWDKISPELDKIVASLKAEDRNAIVLRFFGEKSFAEIGQQLELSENAARMRVDRALEKMRLSLSRKGVVSSAAALGMILAAKTAVAAPAGLGAATVTAALSAPAATGLATFLGAIKIMSTAKITAGVSTVIAIVSVATAIHQYQNARAAEQALLDLQNSMRAARAQTTAPKPTAEPAASNADQTAKPNVATAQPAASAQANNPLSPVLQLLTNPAIQAQSNMLTKIRLDSQFGPLFKQLGFKPAQLEQFKNLIVEKQMVAFDSITAANEQGINPFMNPKGFFQVVSAAEKTVDTQIANLLGEDGFKQFNAYQETVPARNTVNYMIQALSFTDAPLSAEQAERVVQTLATQGTAAIPPMSPFAVLNSDLGVIKLSEQGRTQLQGVLSEQQMRVLDEKLQQQQQLYEIRTRIGHPEKAK